MSKSTSAKALKTDVKISGELSQNLEIAALAKEIKALKEHIKFLQEQLDEKANKNEVTSIVAWDVKQSNAGASNNAAQSLLDHLKKGLINWLNSNDYGAMEFCVKTALLVYPKIRALATEGPKGLL